jgi:cell division protein FtsA
MQGMVELGEEVFHMPVRLGVPQYQGGLSEVMHHARYATGVGLLLAGLDQQDNPAAHKFSGVSIIEKMKSWFKNF